MRTAPSRSMGVKVPDAVHPHMSPKDDVAGKPEEQVLAARVHPLDRSTADGKGVVSAHDSGEDRFEARDRAASECLVERARSTEDRVAFGHQQIPNPRSQAPNPNLTALGIWGWDLGFGIHSSTVSSRSTSEKALSGSISLSSTSPRSSPRTISPRRTASLPCRAASSPCTASSYPRLRLDSNPCRSIA